MSIEKKSFELQAQVRHNANELKGTLSDLYNWEQEIKDKEKNLQRLLDETERGSVTKPPMRGNVVPAKTNAPVEQCSTKADVKNTTKPTTECNKNSLHESKEKIERTNVANKDVNKNNHLVKDSPEKQIQPLDEIKSVKRSTEKAENPLHKNEEKRLHANEIKERGNTFVKAGKYDEAIEAYTQAIEIYPEDATFYSNRALCYLKLESYEHTIDDCNSAIKIDKNCLKAYYRRMQAHESLGNNIDALKDCTTILSVDPKNSETKKSLQRINDKLKSAKKIKVDQLFSKLRSNEIEIQPIDKPPHKRSSKPLQRIDVIDTILDADLSISDDDIDKIFNGNCGTFEKVETKPDENYGIDPIIAQKTKIIELNEDKLTSKSTNKNSRSDSKILVEEISNNGTNIKSLENDIPKVKQMHKSLSVPTISSNRPLPSPPKSTSQFYANWKELDNLQKYTYLKSIDVNKLSYMLGAGFESDTLTDILTVIYEYYLPIKDPQIVETMLQICKNKQVPILSLFMSANDKEMLTDILNIIKEDEKNIATAEIIAKNFNFALN
ncbi:RNA polymerase II-associated protein 3-like [Teleopsis dalmanni]|uniref:RNA polymerase II-associated protein 3-like n=1 Tax=Teleopsis dalmanni TaxID=139649 RepID=UPI0018CDD7DA|nr:RNA polymerase II-associated protein 3-like [Teleopsis dalmanni]